jgi:hypothetical protein
LSLFPGYDRAWTVCHGFQFSGFAFIALRGVLSRSIVIVSVIDFSLKESGSFIVRHACFYPALRARLNLDHSHCLHMSLSGLERIKNGWHSVHMDSINMITETTVIVMKQYLDYSLHHASGIALSRTPMSVAWVVDSQGYHARLSCFWHGQYRGGESTSTSANLWSSSSWEP